MNSKNAWNDNLAAIFEAKLKAAIDNRGGEKMTIFKHSFWPKNMAFLIQF